MLLDQMLLDESVLDDMLLSRLQFPYGVIEKLGIYLFQYGLEFFLDLLLLCYISLNIKNG